MLENFVSVDGNKIRYLDSGGSKEPLVMVHGLGAGAERWELAFPFLKEKYRLIVPDLIGFGLSEKPQVDYTIDYFVDFFSNFISSMELDRPNIVGSSLGGQVSAEFTSANSDSVKKLVLVSPSGMMKHSTPALDAYVLAALYPSEESAKNAYQLMAGELKFELSEDVASRIIGRFVERMQLPNAKMAFMSTLLGLKNAEVISKKLKKISTPTMVIWGEKDPVILPKYGDEFASHIPNCKLHKMQNSGHTPYVDSPEKFSDIVLEFLSK